MTSSPLELLRPKPFRGDVVAAGAVVLTTLVWVLSARFGSVWGAGAHLAYAVATCAFVVALAVLSPTEGETPRAYQSVLYVASVGLFVAVILWLQSGIGRRAADSTGAATWTLGSVAVFALGFAVRRNSAVCTLLGSLAGGAAVLTAVDWIFTPHDIVAFRWTLVALLVIFGVLAIGQRDRRPRHGVALIDAAGLAVLAIAVSLVIADVVGGILNESGEDVRAPGVAWGWELLVLAGGFGLIAYSSVDRQPGPAYIGVLNLIGFTFITSVDGDVDDPSLLGWPLVLGLMAAFLLVVGLRPTTPAPPPPDVDAPEPPPLPLR